MFYYFCCIPLSLILQREWLINQISTYLLGLVNLASETISSHPPTSTSRSCKISVNNLFKSLFLKKLEWQVFLCSFPTMSLYLCSIAMKPLLLGGIMIEYLQKTFPSPQHLFCITELPLWMIVLCSWWIYNSFNVWLNLQNFENITSRFFSTRISMVESVWKTFILAWKNNWY